MPGEKAGSASSSETLDSYEAVILGAGVSGLVSASVLLAKGYRDILIADTYPHLGGNHIDWSSGGYTFDVGSFIFQDDSPLLRHFPELLTRYQIVSPTWGRLTPRGIVTSYPISVSDDILRPGWLEWMRISSSVIRARLFQRDISNAREFARYWIGDHLLDTSGLESYMKRFYGVAPDQIDVELAEKRMQWISEHASFQTLAHKLFRRKPVTVNHQLVRPRQGFAHLYEVAAESLRRRGVTFLLGAGFQSLEKSAGVFLLRLLDREIRSPRVISTIPINHLEAICGLKSQSLESVTLLSLFFSFFGDRGFQPSILYNFSHQGAWKRLTMHSSFYGRSNDREFFNVEVIGNHVDFSTDLAKQDFVRHVRANGLFDGDLKCEGSMVLKNAYPIYSRGSAESAARSIRALKEFGIETFGRQGGFDYQPTARVSTIVAESSLNR